MGKDFIPINENLPIGFPDKSEVYEYVLKKLYKKDKVKEASTTVLFWQKPDVADIENIELGDKEMGTNETLIRLKDKNFVVLEGTMSLKEAIQRDKKRLEEI